MRNVAGIPTTRLSDLWVRQRVTEQLQYHQKELFRLQNQLATGRQFELPSEEPLGALRVIGLQRLLERKEHIRSNLSTTQSFLSATDTALSGISDLVAEARAVAMGVIGTVATDEQRAAAAQQIEQAIRQLMNAGNQEFRGRYLFAGSTTAAEPFQQSPDGAVQHLGNEEPILTYSDIDLLSTSNVTGSAVFGCVSEPVRGSVDLNPILRYGTRLADLNGGQGISPGSVAISDGTHTSVVDLSTAHSIGDVAALLRAHPPETRTVEVEVTATGLVVRLDPAPGDFSIREVGGGTTAYELGILRETGIGNNPIVGDDLDPILRPTTRLDDVLGTRARAVIRFAGPDNDLLIEADTRGAALDGVEIRLIDDASVLSEWAEYDPAPVPPRIDVHIDENRTQAQHVLAAFTDAYDPVLFPFTARLDPLDDQNGGKGLVSATPPGETAGVTAGGSGIEFDQDSGLRITSGTETYTIDLSGATTIEDLLNLLNGSEAGLLAEINEDATGINVRSRKSGADFAIGENGGSTATQLGLRTFTAETRLKDLNFGLGVTDYQGDALGGAEFVITRADGVTLEIDVAGAETIGDLLDRINNHPDNLASGVPLVARLAEFGGGIELVDNSLGPGTLTVARNLACTAAVELGLVPEGQDSNAAAAVGPPQVLSGADVHLLETEGLFTALLRLREGLESGDLWTAERAVQMLDASVEQLNLARAELGARQQGLDALELHLDNEEVELRGALSLEYDADMVEVISNLTARETALQATLQSTAAIFQMTLLDYL